MSKTTRRKLVPHASCLLLLVLAAPPLLAQGKDMGQAQQYYQQPKTKGRFKFQPAPKQKGGEATWHIPEGANGHQEIVKDEYVILYPDVSFTYQDVKMHADKVTYNVKTKDVVAEGHVIIDQGPTRLTADHIVFNVETKTGTLFNASGALQPDFYFVGEKIEKTGDQTYRLTNGIFTSCDLDNPSWSFHVQSADITLDDYAHMRDVSLRAHKVPLFWTPRLVWPTKHDRAQGLLMPRLRHSSDFGDRLELGYFIPIGDTIDTTIYADLATNSSSGAGVNIRYRPSQDVKLGDFYGYTVHDKLAQQEQWKYHYQHSQDNLPGGFRGVVDVEDFSNIDFFRRYDADPRIHTLSQIYSSAYLTKNRSTYSFNFLTDRRDIFAGVSSDPRVAPARQRFEQLPALQFRMYPNKIGDTPFYFSIESSASHLRTTGLTNGPEADYARADVFPTLSMQLNTPAWFSVRPQISARETYYSQSLDPATATTPFGPQNAVDQSITRFYAQGQVDVVGPSFSRVYNEELGGFSRFKHVIEPRFRYVYTSTVNDQDRIIRFDTVDTPFLPIVQNSVEYSLTQRLIGREKGANASSREILSFSLRQTVALSERFTNGTSGSLTGTSLSTGNNRFTPLVASLHVNPYQSITFDASTTWGNVSHQIDQTSVSANLVGTGARADKYLSFTWFANFRDPHATFDTSSSQISLNTGSSLLRDRVRADVQFKFDSKNGEFLEQRFLVGGNASCYGVAFEFRRFQNFVPVLHFQTSYGIAITLKNIGTIGTH
jgi:LPS-assembly protein